MQENKLRRLGKILLSVLSVSILTGFNEPNVDCETEILVERIWDWSGRIEEEYNRTYEFEIMVRDELHHIDSWGDANIGDIWFEVIEEMQELAANCEFDG